MDCPNCRLINPPEAVACDCGYSFQTGAIDRHLGPAKPDPHKVQRELQTLVALIFCIGLVRCLLASEAGPVSVLVFIEYYGAYLIVIGALAWAVYNRSQAARIAMIVLTFPLGLFFLLRDSIRQHVHPPV